MLLPPEALKKYLKSIDALGMSPVVLVKAIEMAQDPSTDTETFSALLHNDGALTADIIRISNSPYYAPVMPHSNLMSAISQLGFGEIIHLINLSLANQLFAHDLLSYGVTAYDYWCDSIATALVMEALSKSTGQDPEDAYTLGILHAIGRVLINSAIKDKGYIIFWDEQRPIEEWERDAVGYDFAEAGAMLLEHWKFPSQTCEVIRNQLQPQPADQPVSVIGTLQCAQRLLAVTGLAFENQTWLDPETDPFLKELGFTHESMAQLVTDCRENFQRICKTVDW
jgi:HD-like signal output (HDOD) protein